MTRLTLTAVALITALALPAAPALADGVTRDSRGVHGSAQPNSGITDRGPRGITAGGAPNGI